MPVDPERLRAIMRHWSTGICIVSASEHGHVHGMTVNSFTSVTLEPPLVLVSLERITRTHGMVERTGAFAVSILHDGQQALSERFAGRDTEHAERFDGVATHTHSSGAPVLDDCLATLDCRVVAQHVVGTHSLFLGEALAGEAHNHRPPLLYFRRDYRRVADG